jgi:hypothetical protein
MLRLVALATLLLALAAPARGDDSPATLQADTPRAFLPLVLGPPATVSPPTSNLPVTAATYLGGAGADQLNGAAIAPDGSVVLGGTLPGHNPSSVVPVTLLGGTNGVVVRLAPDGRSVRSVTRIGGSVTDLEINEAGKIAVCGDFGVAVLSADASAAEWSANPGSAKRCAIGADGTVAVLVGNQVTAYGPTGAQLGSWTLTGVNGVGSTANDIAVDGARASVFATGFAQVSGNLQLPYLRAFAYDGTLKWRSYDIASAPGLGADTRGERLAVGRDGKLYLAGSINGGTGASIFGRDPQDVNTPLGARLVTTDTFNNPTNVGSVKMAWFGRFNPADGTLELAQSLLTRLSSGRGNSIGIEALAADETGKLYIVGDSACCIKDRRGGAGEAQILGVGGVTVGNYEGGEGYFLALSADFRTRLAWTVFAAPGRSAGGSPISAVAVRGGVVALAGTLNVSAGATRGLITVGALQPQPGSEAASEGYAVVMPAP